MATHHRNPSYRRGGPSPHETQHVTISTTDIQLKAIAPNLFSDVAQEKARIVAQGKTQRTNNSTQLRRFYDELVMWHDKVLSVRSDEIRNVRYQEAAPFIQMMIAKAAYAKGRGHVEESFEKLFSDLIRQIDDVASLRHAKLFMEAFLGFYKAQEK